MSVKEKISEKIDEIEEASDVMQPIEDLHLWNDLKRLATDIVNASDQMIPIKDLHLGKDLKRMAKEIEDAQNVMFRFPETKAEHIDTLLRSYFNASEKPVLLCDINKVVLIANNAAIAKYGEDILDKSAAELGLSCSELRDPHNRISGYCLTEE